jgi:Transposase IS66 family
MAGRDGRRAYPGSAFLAAHRRQQAGPVLQSFAEWLAAEVPRVLPKSKIGEAVGYAANQWPTLIRYVEDGRLTIDNSPAEQAIRVEISPITVDVPTAS